MFQCLKVSNVDCEQSLSFPSVFLAFLRASVELWSSEQRAAKPRDARARRKRKIPSPFLSLICIILMSSARGGFQEQKPTTRSLFQMRLYQFFYVMAIKLPADYDFFCPGFCKGLCVTFFMKISFV